MLLRCAYSLKFMRAPVCRRTFSIDRSTFALFRCWCSSITQHQCCGYSTTNSSLQQQPELNQTHILKGCWRSFHSVSNLEKISSGTKKSDSQKGTLIVPNASKIEVIGSNGESLGQMDRGKASRLAIDSDLKLVLLQPANESQPIATYQLMTAKVYRDKLAQQKDSIERSEKAKHQTTKVIKLKSSIAEHDLEIKVSHVVELLKKGHSVKVDISILAKAKNQDKIFNHITAVTKDLAVIKQARKTESLMTFELRAKAASAVIDDSSNSTAVDSEMVGVKPLRLLKMDELKKLKTAAVDTSKPTSEQS